MPLPRCQGRQPLQDLALVVRVIPYIKAVRHVTDVFVYSNSRDLKCGRAHLALPRALIVVGGAVRRSKAGATRERGFFLRGLGQRCEAEKLWLYKHYSSRQIEVAFSSVRAPDAALIHRLEHS